MRKKIPVKTKVKVRKKSKARIEDQRELEERQVNEIPKRAREKHGSKSDVPTKDLVQVIADSVEKGYEELMPYHPWTSESHKRANAEDTALLITRSLVYGIHGQGEPVKIRETEFGPLPLCKEHRG